MSIVFICPSCRNEVAEPVNWEAINISSYNWGIKFCPECYKNYKDKDLTWDDLEKGILKVK